MFKLVFFFVAILPICGCTLEAIEKTGQHCPDYVFLIHNDASGNTIVECADEAGLSDSQTCPLDAEFCLTDEADRNFCAINVSLGEEEAKKFPCRSSSEDEDCDCPDHQICVNHQCFDKPDVKCKCKEDETCDANGECIPTVKKCSDDEDCPEGLICLNDICAAPISPLQCTTDEDCSEGLVCVEDKCSEPVIHCTADEDCPEGQVCLDGHCDKPVIECSGDEDCPEGWVCSDDICTEFFTTCSVDEDCPEGLTCSDEICVAPYTPIECMADDDCAGGEICSSGFCIDPEIPVECVSDVDCSEGKTCQSNVCVDVAPKPECSSDADCASGKSCKSNVCVDVAPEPECSESKPCSGELICKDNTCQSCPAKTYYLKGNCVQCTSHDHCGSNAYCNASNACVECGDQKVNSAKNACVECNSNSDCPAGNECKAEKCKPKTPTCDKNSEVLCNNECVTSKWKIIITATENDSFKAEVKSSPESSADTIWQFLRYDTPDIYGKKTTSSGNTWYIVIVDGQTGYVSGTKAKELPVLASSIKYNVDIYDDIYLDKNKVGSIKPSNTVTLTHCHEDNFNNHKWCYVKKNSTVEGYLMAADTAPFKDIVRLGDSTANSVPRECK